MLTVIFAVGPAEALHAKERKSEKKGKRNRKKYSLSIEDNQLEEVKKMDPAEVVLLVLPPG